MLVKNLKAEIPGFGSINLAEKLRPTSQDLGHPPLEEPESGLVLAS